MTAEDREKMANNMTDCYVDPGAAGSGIYPALAGTIMRARARLSDGEPVVVVALCAERALARLGLSKSSIYEVVDQGPYDKNDPTNIAHLYRIRLKW